MKKLGRKKIIERISELILAIIYLFEVGLILFCIYYCKKQHCVFFRKNFFQNLLTWSELHVIQYGCNRKATCCPSYSGRHILKRRITMYLEKINSPSVIKNQGGIINQSVIICRR